MASDSDPIEAELAQLDAEDGKPPSGPVRRILPAVLAAITLSAFAGVVWYAYSTGVREGSEGAAPVLKAEGPSKVAPTTPGGENIPDQDKLVYGKIDKSAGERKVERLLPPPENPLPVPIARKPPLPAAKLDVPNTPPTSGLPPPPSITAPRTSDDTPVEDVEPSAGSPAPETIEKAAAPKPAAPSKPKAPSKPDSPAKPPKPAKPSAPDKPAAAPGGTAVASMSPEADPATGYRIQIGSLRSEDAAKLAWEKQLKQHGTVLSKLSLLVSRADLGKRGIYYRVQAGPLQSKEAAQRICDELKQKKTGCFVVKP